MTTPQGGIVPEPNGSALFIVLRVPDPPAKGRQVARAAAAVPALVEAVGRIDPGAELVSTVSFGSDFWDVISPGRRPAGLRRFKAISAGKHQAPDTGGDVLLHIISKRADLNAELMLRTMAQFGDAVEVLDQVQGFRYLDSRDLTGFIDGTENPTGDERAEVALIGEEDANFAGGSYVFTQRYVHDLRRWGSIEQNEQEKVIGRRKADSEELADDVKPPTAHISRVVIQEDGDELEIVRHSFPYATATEAGLFFIAYTKDLAITERMLARMMGVSGDGLHDHLMDYTRAVSGATFFAPSLDVLQSLG